MADQFDYLVIGGGSGGIASARRAAEYGVKVAVVESARLGGTCVNVGCVPKKVMWNTAHIADILKLAKDYGFNVDANNLEHNWSVLKEKRDAYIARLNGIYESNLDKSEVTLLSGTASFIDQNTVSVNGKSYSAKHILIATGGTPWRPNIPGAEYGIDSDGFFELSNFPKKVAIIGAGYIATELAGVLHGFGSNVTQIVRKQRLLKEFDKDVVELVTNSMTKSGINIKFGFAPTKLEKNEDGLITIFNDTESGREELSDFDCVIWATGRKPNLSALNLDKTGVEIDSRGYVKVDEYQNTNVNNVYAVGDIITNGIELTPVAIAAGRQLSERLFNQKDNAKCDYSDVASVIFSHPAIGTVGLSEEQAIDSHGEDNVRVYKSTFVNMIYAMMDAEPAEKPKTFAKLVTLKLEGWTESNAEAFEKVIGCHIVGEAADEIIQGFSVAVKLGATKADFDRTIAIHPTASEELVTMR